MSIANVVFKPFGHDECHVIQIELSLCPPNVPPNFGIKNMHAWFLSAMHNKKRQKPSVLRFFNILKLENGHKGLVQLVP